MATRGWRLVNLALNQEQHTENVVANSQQQNLPDMRTPSPCPSIKDLDDASFLPEIMVWSQCIETPMEIENYQIVENVQIEDITPRATTNTAATTSTLNTAAPTVAQDTVLPMPTTDTAALTLTLDATAHTATQDNAVPMPTQDTAAFTLTPDAAASTLPPDIAARTPTPETAAPALTKKGTTRKRKPKVSKKDQDVVRNEKRLKKLAVRESPCVNNCRLKCINKISEERRQQINLNFVNMSWQEQKTFIMGHTSKENVKRHYSPRTADGTGMKSFSMKYALLNKDGHRENVCKSFFLTTLGFHHKNDSVIYQLFSKSKQEENTNGIIIIQDGRGKAPAVNKINREPIVEHIESYNPTISHYRRSHAPNVRYLPSDVTVSDMYKDFKEKHPQMELSYDLYRKVVKGMRIHFTKLGHEECEDCEDFELHDKTHTKNPQDYSETCVSCADYLKHRNRAEQSREAYRVDKETDFTTDIICVSVDLQKIIMLPRIDVFKSVLFTPRLIAYHESFVRVGQKQKLPPYAVTWHEAISGRSKEDIISTFYSFLGFHRDAKNIILWADNCSAQNKNWAFFSFLIYIINSDEIAAEEIVIKYFEAGHTFMSADTFHHSVEKSLKSQGKTYDFNDFQEAIRKATSSHVDVKVMEHSDFFEWRDYSSTYKLNNKKINAERPYMSDIVLVRATRGLRTLAYKTSFNGDELEMNFLNKIASNVIEKPQARSAPVGIKAERKKNIIDKLGRLMPANRLNFWKNLPTLQGGV